MRTSCQSSHALVELSASLMMESVKPLISWCMSGLRSSLMAWNNTSGATKRRGAVIAVQVSELAWSGAHNFPLLVGSAM